MTFDRREHVWGNLVASYVHVHFWSKPEWGSRFVEACRGVRPLEVGVPALAGLAE